MLMIFWAIVRVQTLTSATSLTSAMYGMCRFSGAQGFAMQSWADGSTQGLWVSPVERHSACSTPPTMLAWLPGWAQVPALILSATQTPVFPGHRLREWVRCGTTRPLLQFL